MACFLYLSHRLRMPLIKVDSVSAGNLDKTAGTATVNAKVHAYRTAATDADITAGPWLSLFLPCEKSHDFLY
ncbi:hypothetical protein DOC41_21930 [Salmonella enterica subsp. enterica serovar Manhattan]|nr:hypothetical protein [Salmonella enterica subsp. enterica serovar Manhattan]EBU8489841.1 hypothetical protein [Salmonella enterica subsp. enterica serovar Manhattan]EBU8723424.1 hypothetical protein [Salmonella enterica subsp. enterica serovar Manhattan]EBV3524785.1 hypothetical protein [Salmonella enterica subsp. enterica serovar Manhattan]EBX6960277.1 hypothetical protein [Salmonella enterica subsp. enterica serovar Manhattan]